MPLKPRTIRTQLVAALLAFELALVGAFALFLIRESTEGIKSRAVRRLEFQSNLLALFARESIADGHPEDLRRAITVLANAPSVRGVLVTDAHGGVLFKSGVAMGLTDFEKEHLTTTGEVFSADTKTFEAVAPVIVSGETKGYVWVYPDEKTQAEEVKSLVRLVAVFGALGAFASVLVAIYLAGSITRPLSRLLLATRRLIRDPEDSTKLPLEDYASSEISDLTTAFNLMITSIEEQRSGLNDTLALLDSMLAHAPIGLAFFDQEGRFIRMNQFLADLQGRSIAKNLGRTVTESFPGEYGEKLDRAVQHVFATSEAVRNLEFHFGESGEDGMARTGLVNVYPVRSPGPNVRWVGAVVADTTELKRSEVMLRRTEKLAAVGRLSSSIAHEINNPLEAITNLLYLLRHVGDLNGKALEYTEMAEHEVARMAEIVQQTLRFHRQATRPAVTRVGELIDSILTLHRGRAHGTAVEFVRKYRENVELFCLAGEMRQLFANLVGNAIDAMLPQGGRLTISVRYSRSWQDSSIQGVRITVADTGVGMSPTVQARIFEPFFTTKEATGTGLGLWVSAEIIQKHEGTVRIRSRAAGTGLVSGTVFMLFFPKNSALARTLTAA